MTTPVSPMPDISAPLPNRTNQQLRMLRREIRRRTTITLLEQVAREVGGTVYAEFLPQLWESTTYICRGRIAGLPPGTYVILLTASIRQRRTEMSTMSMD